MNTNTAALIRLQADPASTHEYVYQAEHVDHSADTTRVKDTTRWRGVQVLRVVHGIHVIGDI